MAVLLAWHEACCSPSYAERGGFFADVLLAQIPAYFVRDFVVCALVVLQDMLVGSTNSDAHLDFKIASLEAATHCRLFFLL